MRLLGNPVPHDQLLGRDHRVLSSWSFWEVQIQLDQAWVRMTPRSNNFTVLGTNSSGTFVVRTMTVSIGSYSGVFRIVYKATSAGPLKWDLDFTPDSTAQFRFVYSWHDVRDPVNFQTPSKRLTVAYGSANYTLAWDDIPSAMNTTVVDDQGIISLETDTGTIARGSHSFLDPEIIAPSTPSQAIAFSFQRKVFYEPKGGYYFAFYYDGNYVGYSSSQDGNKWSVLTPMPPGWPAYNDSASSSPSVYYIGQTVVVATGMTINPTVICPSAPCWRFYSIGPYFAIGTVSGATINWASYQGLSVFRTASVGRACFSQTTTSCTMTLSARYVSVALASKGPVVSYNLYINGPASPDDRVCGSGSGWSTENDVAISYNGATWFAECESNTSTPLRSVVMPGDANGGIRVVYQYHVTTSQLALATRYIATTLTSVIMVPLQDTYVESCCQMYNKVLETDPDLGLDMPVPGTSYNARTYIKFASLPSGSAVSLATLSFTIDKSATGGITSIASFEPSSDWQESSLTFATQPSGVIYSSYSSNSSVNLASFGNGATLRLDVTNAVKGFLEERWGINYGLRLELAYNSSLSGAAIFAYSQETTYSPRLNVTYACCMSDPTTVDPSVQDSDQFSAVTDANYGVHVAYRSVVDGNTSYASLSPAGTWTRSINLYPSCSSIQCFSFPSLTVDLSTNDLYFLEIQTIQNIGAIWLMHKSLGQSWTDVSSSTIATCPLSPANLSSNFASISGTNASFVTLLFTTCKGFTADVEFASIPIQTVWSPFASPSDPWNGYGIAPYGEYFRDLGEYVSTSSGLLAVRQTDLTVPGRGLDLSITRVYTEPSSFLNGGLVNYETYPWAMFGGLIGPNWGGAWQLDFPWMTKTATPLYIHLWNGEGYRIPSSFWFGSKGVFESHLGEQFRMVRNSDNSTVLNDKAGIAYNFDPGHRLTSIIDPTGSNSITFSYNSYNEIGCITDTLSRAYEFGYQSGGLIQSISEVTGTCASPGTTTIRKVSYGYNGVLSSVTDPAGRVTSYLYKATGDANVAPYLLSRITYPTQWYTNFTYIT